MKKEQFLIEFRKVMLRKLDMVKDKGISLSRIYKAYGIPFNLRSINKKDLSGYYSRLFIKGF